MTASATPPIALGEGEGEALWFAGGLVTIKASAEATLGGAFIYEHLAPQGDGPPLHVHHREDECFYVLEGELTLWVGGQVIEARAGSFAFGPREVPHTYVVPSPGARFLVVTEPAGFEGFVRSLAEPAQTRTLPPAADLPDRERVQAAAAEHGIDILGPPGIPA